jgi:hypothetical protein
MKATDEAIDRIGQVRSRVDQKFRVVLEQKVREIFRQVSFKEFEDFIWSKMCILQIANH